MGQERQVPRAWGLAIECGLVLGNWVLWKISKQGKLGDLLSTLEDEFDGG